ncbi:transcriptional regulator, AraC family [[Clostridium] methylpentosum DSM 5476]|uniref:Transcriptional regulator, AraC family n=1 Tax=[Clostridium] methylpentosum DSM 5476 TaxID=537013 RepID=C0E9Q1_9FIRM|nr:transcriptional regulator, AraC family [[Clostridium] methylpentosum DSM 5476]MDY3990103.1 AraC family transcriptional regulator [Massilioclostridium sp.]MEE1492263.1 AraC family transcriptional regulator [Massilioclostridium sp.]
MIDLSYYIKHAVDVHPVLQRDVKHQRKFNDELLTVFDEDSMFAQEEAIKIHLHPPTAVSGPVIPPEHSHDFFEIIYVYSGQFFQEINGISIVQNKGQSALLNLGAKHKVWVEHSDDIVFNILIRKSMVEQVFLQLISKNNLISSFFLNSLYGMNSKKNLLLFDQMEELDEIFCGIIREYYDRDFLYEENIIGRLVQLFSIWARIYYKRNDQEKNEITEIENDSVIKMLDYIQSHYNTVTLDDLANYLGYSRRHVSRLLKMHTNRNLSEIVNDLKIKNACIYLNNTGLPVDKISEIIGFKESSYFYKIFKKQMGCSISKYRQTLKTGNLQEKAQ